MKKIVHILQLLITLLFFALFWVLGRKWASNFGGFLARILGRFTKAHKIAIKNISTILPDSDATQIATKMWDNLGRTFAEIPHIGRIIKNDVTIKNLSDWHAVESRNSAKMYISAHFANWEISTAIAHANGLDIKGFYRPANNPYFDKLLQKWREKFSQPMMPKGKNGMKILLKRMISKKSVGLLIDQRSFGGIEANFMGKIATNSSTVVECYKRYQAEIVPLYLRREGKYNFVFEIEKPLDLQGLSDVEIINKCNERLEKWIRANPEQWFWVHNRWKI